MSFFEKVIDEIESIKKHSIEGQDFSNFFDFWYLDANQDKLKLEYEILDKLQDILEQAGSVEKLQKLNSKLQGVSK